MSYRRFFLIRLAQAYPRRHTSFAVLDGRSFQISHRIGLRGEWGFDAVSPDGSTLYLIQQTSRQDRTRYAVRAYDLRAQRLLRAPVVDPAEPDEPMRGLPVTRTTGPGGVAVRVSPGAAVPHREFGAFRSRFCSHASCLLGFPAGFIPLWVLPARRPPGLLGIHGRFRC